MTDRVQQSNTEAQLLAPRGTVHPLRADEVDRSLAASLVPTVDSIRQIATDLGVRPYRVFMVHVLWSGERIGEGQPVVVSRREILPTPRVRDVSSTSLVYSSLGPVEEGSIVVDKVSGALAEDDLTGKTLDLLDPVIGRTGKRNGEFFWEVIEQRSQLPNPVPRRYTISAAPTLNQSRTSWRVLLAKQSTNRSRDLTFDRRAQ